MPPLTREEQEELRATIELNDEHVHESALKELANLFQLYKNSIHINSDKKFFTKKIRDHLEQFSTYDAQKRYANILMQRFDADQMEEMLGYYIQKGLSGQKMVAELLTTYITKDNLENGDKLNRCLMIAAWLGDEALYDKIKDQGGIVFQEGGKILSQNSSGKTVLHYACRSLNPKLTKKIAEDIRTHIPEEQLEKLTGEKGVFDPFRIRDDLVLRTISEPTSNSFNIIRPIHNVSVELAQGLDVQYGLENIAQGSFGSAVNYYKIKHKVQGQGLQYIKDKIALHHKVLGDSLLAGKFGSGYMVANIAEEAPNALLKVIESYAFIEGFSALWLSGKAIQNYHHIKQAIQYSGASKTVELPPLANPQHQNYQFSDKNNIGLIRALQKRDFDALNYLTPYNFKNTDKEVIIALKQLSSFAKAGRQANENIAVLFRKLADKADLNEKIELAKILNERGETSALQASGLDTIKITEYNSNSNKHLEKALKEYDYYRIYDIISKGNFNRCSNKVMEHLDRIAVFPPQLSFTGGRNSINPLVEIYQGLAVKCAPHKLEHLLNQLINTRNDLQATTKVINALIDQLAAGDRERSYTEDVARLKICALFSAKLGDIPSMNKAISALRNKNPEINLLEIVDKNNSNLLHYACSGQQTEIIKDLYPQLSKEFKLATEKEKSETLFSFKSRTAHDIFELSNIHGEQPRHYLRDKETVKELDAYFDTVNFRIDGNEAIRAKAKAHLASIDNAVAATCATFFAVGIAGVIIPATVKLARVAAHLMAPGLGWVFPNVISGIAEGAVEVGAYLLSERKGTRAMQNFIRKLNYAYSRMKKGDYYSGVIDLDDQIPIKSAEIINGFAEQLQREQDNILNANGDQDAQKNSVLAALSKAANDLIAGEHEPARKTQYAMALNGVMHSLVLASKDSANPALDMVKHVFLGRERLKGNADIAAERRLFRNSAIKFATRVDEEIPSNLKNKLRSHAIEADKLLRNLARFDQQLDYLMEIHAGTTDRETFLQIAIEKAKANFPNGTELKQRVAYLNEIDQVAKASTLYKQTLFQKKYQGIGNPAEKMQEELLSELRKIDDEYSTTWNRAKNFSRNALKTEQGSLEAAAAQMLSKGAEVTTIRAILEKMDTKKPNSRLKKILDHYEEKIYHLNSIEQNRLKTTNIPKFSDLLPSYYGLEVTEKEFTYDLHASIDRFNELNALAEGTLTNQKKGWTGKTGLRLKAALDRLPKLSLSDKGYATAIVDKLIDKAEKLIVAIKSEQTKEPSPQKQEHLSNKIAQLEKLKQALHNAKQETNAKNLRFKAIEALAHFDKETKQTSATKDNRTNIPETIQNIADAQDLASVFVAVPHVETAKPKPTKDIKPEDPLVLYAFTKIQNAKTPLIQKDIVGAVTTGITHEMAKANSKSMMQRAYNFIMGQANKTYNVFETCKRLATNQNHNTTGQGLLRVLLTEKMNQEKLLSTKLNPEQLESFTNYLFTDLNSAKLSINCTREELASYIESSLDRAAAAIISNEYIKKATKSIIPNQQEAIPSAEDSIETVLQRVTDFGYSNTGRLSPSQVPLQKQDNLGQGRS
jgi:ankyrin repeat protein